MAGIKIGTRRLRANATNIGGRNVSQDQDILGVFCIFHNFFMLTFICVYVHTTGPIPYPHCGLHLPLLSFDFMNARVLIFKLNSTTVFSGNSGIIQLHQFVCCYRTADKSSAVFPFISLKHRHQSCSSLLSRTYVHTKTTPGALFRMSRQNLRNGIIMSLFSRLDGQQY